MILNVLVAEDEAYPRRVLTALLQRMRPEYSIISVENGQQALDCIQESNFHILITDIEMPIVNGITLMKEIHESNKNIKVIILSGYDHFEYAQKALKYSAVDYILKPIEPDKILGVIERVERTIEEEQKKQDINTKLKSIYSDYLSDNPNYSRIVLEEDELRKLFGDNYKSVLVDNKENNEGAYIMDRVIDYIGDNFKKDISLESVSGTFHFNPSYFSVLFKKSTGCNFIDYIKKMRIKQAKEMLKNTDKKVYEIAAEIGYRDYQYFCRLFKKMNKVTPSEFRRMQNK